MYTAIYKTHSFNKISMSHGVTVRLSVYYLNNQFFLPHVTDE